MIDMYSHESFVTQPIAHYLKILGFDWPCRRLVFKDILTAPMDLKYGIMDYNSERATRNLLPQPVISAPTLAVAQRWLREEKLINVDVVSHPNHEYTFAVVLLYGFSDSKNLDLIRISSDRYDTYEESLAAGILATLEILAK